MVAHLLGNPFDLGAVADFVKRHNLWLIEDCCDALGATYHGRKVGTFGDLATVSFYPAHHITMGEGGCVLTDSPILKTLVDSFRDWGRDCWCDPGKENTCGKGWPAWRSSSYCPKPPPIPSQVGSVFRLPCVPALHSTATGQLPSWKIAKSPRVCSSAEIWFANRPTRTPR